jgi:hypothetical protein
VLGLKAPDVLTVWQEAIVGAKGRPHLNSDNVTIKSNRGNSKADTLRRLKKDYPELYDRVIAGELSANRAGGIRTTRCRNIRNGCIRHGYRLY